MKTRKWKGEFVIVDQAPFEKEQSVVSDVLYYIKRGFAISLELNPNIKLRNLKVRRIK